MSRPELRPALTAAVGAAAVALLTLVPSAVAQAMTNDPSRPAAAAPPVKARTPMVAGHPHGERFALGRLEARVDRRAVRIARIARHRAAVAASRAEERRRLLSLDPRVVGEQMAADRGWTGSEWECLDALWTRESGWQVHEANGSSGAYGIPQALPASKMAAAGSDWADNPVTQIRWGLDYIAARYGTPCAAWDHSQAYNYY